MPRAARPLHRPGRTLQPGLERDRGVRLRAGPRAGPGGGRGPRPGRGVGAAARPPHDRQGLVRRRRAPDHLGGTRPSRQRRIDERGRHRPAARGRGGHLRQDQRPLQPRRLPELQRDLRHHQQSLGPRARPRRVVRRRRGGPRGRAHRARDGERHRGLHPQSRPLLRGVRTQADVGGPPPSRPRQARRARPDGHLGHRSARARRGGPRARRRGDGRPGPHRGERVEARPSATGAPGSG